MEDAGSPPEVNHSRETLRSRFNKDLVLGIQAVGEVLGSPSSLSRTTKAFAPAEGKHETILPGSPNPEDDPQL